MASIQVNTPSTNSQNNGNGQNNGGGNDNNGNGWSNRGNNGHNDQGNPQQTNQVPMLFESAYLNPFGNPIVFGTADNFATLMVVTPYTHANIFWTQVSVSGSITGTLGSSNIVSGQFSESSNEFENLVTGTAQDSGTMTFSNVVNASGPVTSLDVTGTYKGSSTIPTTSQYACMTSAGPSLCSNSDCTSSLGLGPFEAMTGLSVCTNTGFESQGSFNLHGQASYVSGSYSSAWSVPAFAFGGMASGSVSSPQYNSQNH
jgi:hypothetical protein